MGICSALPVQRVASMHSQIDLFDTSTSFSPNIRNANTSIRPDIEEYDRFVVFFSGGKDSVACVLHLIEMGVPRDKIEMHHHIIDGREGSTLMDWPVTESYCEQFAKAMGLRIFFSWKVVGFEREMTRQDALTAPIAFEREGGGLTITGGERGKTSTRRKFPQVSPDLRVRWCARISRSMLVPADCLRTLTRNKMG